MNHNAFPLVVTDVVVGGAVCLGQLRFINVYIFILSCVDETRDNIGEAE